METEENHGLPGFAQGYGAEGPDDYSRVYWVISSFVLRHSDFVLVNIRAMGGVRGRLLPLRLVSAPRLLWDQT
jgi:hypothetical protein